MATWQSVMQSQVSIAEFSVSVAHCKVSGKPKTILLKIIETEDCTLKDHFYSKVSLLRQILPSMMITHRVLSLTRSFGRIRSTDCRGALDETLGVSPSGRPHERFRLSMNCIRFYVHRFTRLHFCLCAGFRFSICARFHFRRCARFHLCVASF